MSEKQGPPLEISTTNVVGESNAIELDTTYVGAQPKPGKNPKGGGFSVPPTRAGGIGSPQTLKLHLREQTLRNVQATEKSIKNDYAAKSKGLAKSTDVEFENFRTRYPSETSTQAQAYQHELNVRNILLQQKTTELHVQTGLANAFYGQSPLNTTSIDYIARVTTLEKAVRPHGAAYKTWASAYQAAYSAKLLAEQIQFLNIKQVHVQSLLAAAHAREAKQREEAAAKWRAEQDAKLKASLEATKSNRPFPVTGSVAATDPVFTVAEGNLATDAAMTLAIKSALKRAVAAIIARLAASAAPVIGGFAALTFPPPLGNSDLYALSVPLSDLTPHNLDDLYAIAEANGEVDLPVAIGSRTVDDTTQFIVAPTDGTAVPSKVPVRLATLDPNINVYRSKNPDAPSIGMTWTPIVSPNNASTTLPARELNVVVYNGTIPTALDGRLDEFPELDLYSFGGFVTVFPTESGIPPIYTMFRDPRDDPGVASGYGDAVSGIWLGAASQGDGSVIPNQIANKLRGQSFSSFRRFREALWRAAVDDPELAKQFTANNIKEMQNGRAPFSRKNDRLGGQVKFELHHVSRISRGGEIYDIDNLRIVTPKRHSDLHKGGI
ncbi:S-type pyocin domain-containing protein [Pseudomonas sp. XS1P51]